MIASLHNFNFRNRIPALVISCSYLFFAAIFGAGSAVAASEQSYPGTPHETLELVTEELLAAVTRLEPSYDESPESFYEGVSDVVSPWIDFDAIYRGVMGRTYYPQASEEQRQRFKVVFSKSLIETYSKGLLGIEGTRYEIDPVSSEALSRKSVPVKQTLFSGSGRVTVIYSMVLGEEGRWRLKNVILEGINLGKTFRGQFARSARKHNEDLDLVIANWSTEG